ncbi:MAG TPA: glycosyltransferase family 1 protein [Burkholderiaceae bacterium]|nr:glycosyltransferase family 1 protein [Burkholderiaceae bacterium]
MRILIDLQGAQCDSRFRGIGRYSLSLALAMARNSNGHEIWLALSAAFPQSILELRHAFSDLLPQERIRVFSIPQPTAEVDSANAWRARAAEIIREEFLESIQPDVIHIPSLFEGYGDDAVASLGICTQGYKTAVTLHDLIPLLDQTSYLPNPIIRGYYFRKIESIQHAGMLLAISDSSRNEAINALSWPEDKIINTSEGSDAHFQVLDLTLQQVESIRQRYGITRKMVLYAPGGFDSRKNFDGLMQAYALLDSSIRTEYQLVIASRLSKGSDDSRTKLYHWRDQAGLNEDELVLTDFVPDDDLVVLYNIADLFVFPSKHEGFGLPPLEAMACGAPTIASNTSSLPEVLGWDQALFDPHSPKDMAKKMEQALTDVAFRSSLKEHAINQVKNFSWDNSAKRAIAALELLHAKNQAASALEKSAIESKQLQPSQNSILAIANLPRTSSSPDSDLAKAAAAIAFNTSTIQNRQLLVDITELSRHDAKSGIQRVVRSLLLELIKQMPIAYPTFSLRPIQFDGYQYRYANRFMARFLNKSADEQKNSLDDIAEINQDDVFFGLDLVPPLVTKQRDLYQQWRAYGVQVYFVVYDILLAHRPDWAPEEASAVLSSWLDAVTQVATGLVCISNSVADEVRSWLEQNPRNRPLLPTISFFHLGADLVSSAPTKGMPKNALATLDTIQKRPTFLSVGTFEPRKGHWQMLKAFDDLWAKNVDVNLVLIGKQGWMMLPFAQHLRKHPEFSKRLIWLDAISDEYLEKIYAASSCLIAASEGEGFGLPLIEAASHHLPIIARDLPVFHEVAGEHAFYFSGLSGEDLSKAVMTWLDLHAQHEAPKSDNMSRLTWSQSCQQILPLIIRANKEKF